MATADEIIVKLTANTDDLQSGMDAGANGIAAAMQAIQEAIAQSAAAFQAAADTMQAAAAQIAEAFAESGAAVDAALAQNVASAKTASKAIVAATDEQRAAQEAAFAAVMQREQEAAAAREAEIAAWKAQQAVSEEASAQSAAEAAAFNAGVLAKREALATWTAALKGVQAGTVEVADAEAALDAAMAAGAMTAAEQTAAVEALNVAEKDAATAATAMAVAQDAAAAASLRLDKDAKEAAAATNLLTRNSRTAYSASALISDALSGQFSRSKRELAALANETGVMGGALNALLSPIGLVAAAIVGLGVAGLEGADNWATLRGVIADTNGAIGMSAQGLEDLARSSESGDQSLRNARDALEKLGESGLFTGEQLKLAEAATVDFANITGEKADKAAEAMIRMAQDPKKALVDLNNVYGFLSVAQAQNIANLLKEGDNYDALNAILAATKDGMDAVAKAHEDARSPVGKLWDAAITGISDFGQKLEDIVDGNALVKFWNDAAKAFNSYSNQLAQGSHGMLNMGQMSLWGGGDQGSDENSARAKQKQKGQVKNILDPSAGADKADREATQKDEDEFLKMQQARNKSLQDDLAYWQRIEKHAKDGSDEWRQAAHKVVEYQNQIASAEKEAGNKAEAAARKAAEEAKRMSAKEKADKLADLQNVVDDTERGSQQRIDAERKVLTFVTAAYGQESSQYRSAHRAMLDDEKAFHAQEIADAKSAAQQKEAADLSDIDGARQDAEQQYQLGEISLQQRAALEVQLVQKKLQAELGYFNTMKALEAGNVVAVANIQKQITEAVAQAAKERGKITSQEIREEMRLRQQAARFEAMEVSRSVQQILFSHQSLKQSLANIGEQMLGKFIDIELQKIAMAWSSQAQQNSAVLFGAGVRVATETTAAATTKAINKSTNQDQISSAAATGAAKAYQAIVGIPYVGPILAPIAAAVAFAGIEAFASSAEGGWERVPADGMMTQLHKDEMVLPKHVADPVRNMAKGGGVSNAGGNQYHFHSFDSRGIFDYARRNRADFAAAMKHVARMGHLS